jgi:hypothetical protein
MYLKSLAVLEKVSISKNILNLYKSSTFLDGILILYLSENVFKKTRYVYRNLI